ncbi:hypothetical protein FACS1894166_04630 [Bacilli bacterium]|nr:hypothetical protein FACS1894166_04630 [Bacilli bacterium]
MKNKLSTIQDKFIKQVGERVKEIRNSKNLSQMKLSLAISDHYSLISKVEAGKNVTLSTLISILNGLDIKPSDFFREFK